MGHNRVRDVVHALTSLGDPTSSTEPYGLLPSWPSRRPSDVLTAAIEVDGYTAIDIGVASPWTARGGADAAGELRLEKLRKATPWLQELREAGIEYEPLTATTFGRWEEGSHRLLRRLAARAARRLGLGGAALLSRRFFARLGVELQRRAVAVLRACLPAVPPGGWHEG